MIRPPFNLEPLLWGLWLVVGTLVALQALGVVELPLAVLIACVLVGAFLCLRNAMLLRAALREARRVRRDRELVAARLEAARSLRAPDDIPRVAGPTRGQIRRARQSRRRPRHLRKRRTGEWG